PLPPKRQPACPPIRSLQETKRQNDFRPAESHDRARKSSHRGEFQPMQIPVAWVPHQSAIAAKMGERKKLEQSLLEQTKAELKVAPHGSSPSVQTMAPKTHKATLLAAIVRVLLEYAVQ